MLAWASALLLAALPVLAAPFHGLSTLELAAQQLTTRARVHDRYIFTVFPNPDEHELYVYDSSNASEWSLLKGPAWTPPSGSTIRDPSVIYHTEYVATAISIRL
jgi:hypothetical protein